MSRFTSPRARTLRRIYVLVAVFYLVLGALMIQPAIAQQSIMEHTINPVAPIPNYSSQVPTGNDDATVEAYYDYLNLQQLNTVKEQYVFDWQHFLITYLLIAVFIIFFYLLVLTWYARRAKFDLYPVEVFNGVITERSGPVDPLSWGAFSILGIYMVYYIVIQLIYGQLY